MSEDRKDAEEDGKAATEADEAPRVPEEKKSLFLRNPRNRGIMNGVAIFGILCLAQIDGMLGPARPLNERDLASYAVTGTIAGLLIYYWYRWREQKRRQKEQDNA